MIPTTIGKDGCPGKILGNLSFLGPSQRSALAVSAWQTGGVVTSHASPRRRRRGRQLEDALLDGVWAEMVEHGWAGFNMGRASQRAGASKKSLYSRWPNKSAAIAAAARRSAVTLTSPVASVGDLADDLCNALLSQAELLRGPLGSAARGLYAELPHTSPDTSSLSDDTFPLQAGNRLIEEARARGELSDGPIPALAITVGFRLTTLHYLAHDEPPGPDAIRDIVESIWLPCIQAAAAKDVGPG